MIKDLPPPTEAEECRNTAEILRDLAVQTQFGKTRSELFNCAENLDRLAALPSPSINLKLGFKRFAHHLTSDPSRRPWGRSRRPKASGRDIGESAPMGHHSKADTTDEIASPRPPHSATEARRTTPQATTGLSGLPVSFSSCSGSDIRSC